MKNIIFLVLIFVVKISYTQSIFNNERLGFKIEQPGEWIKADEELTNENLKSNIKLDEKVIAKLIEQSKGTIQVVTFFKYPVETTSGVIPTIKVNLRNNPHKNFTDFRKNIEISLIGLKKVFPDFAYKIEPNETVIDNKKCITASCIYTITSKNGSEKVNMVIYAIPVKNQFYQITLMDTEEDNNTELFKKIINTINIE